MMYFSKDVMNEYKPKKTKGQTKYANYLSDLFSNELFLAEVQKAKDEKDAEKQSQMYWEIAEKYNLEYSSPSPFLDFLGGTPNSPYCSMNHSDVCQITDEPDEYLNDVFEYDYNTPPSQRPDKRMQLLTYPIHIGISPKASKRDILDFINKRWTEIRDYLDMYEENPTQIRTRRKKERDEFIWENKDVKSSKLAELVNDKFPNESLTYSDIHKILYSLRKRKKSELV